MRLKINLKKIVNFLKRLPKTIVRRAFLFYIFFFLIEAFFGLVIYYHYAFPDVIVAESSQLGVDRQLIERAVERLDKEREESGGLEDKEYFNLIKLPEEEISQEEVIQEETSQEESEEGYTVD